MTENQHRTLGKYEISDEIGRGASAVVYEARDTSLDRLVALKVMHPGLLWNPGAVERFMREARAAAQLDHPNIVTIYEVGEEEGSYYIAMRYLPGPSVAGLIAEGPLDIERALEIAIQVADALGHAHERGFIHRDVKPTNIILDSRGQAVVTDFGLVKALEWASLSGSGGIMGTPGYIAPEIWDGEQATSATDVYGLGVVLWEMLAGQRLFEGDTPAAVMKKHLVGSPPPLSEVQPDASAVLARVVAQILDKDPMQRHTATALARALQANFYSERGKSRRQQDDYEQSIADYSRAIELIPDEADYYLERGKSYHQNGDYERAIADKTRAIQLVSNQATYYASRGNSHRAAHDFDGAIADFTRAIELDPSQEIYYRNRAKSRLRQFDFDQTAAEVSRALDEGDTDKAEHYTQSFLENDFDSVAADLTHAIELAPNHANHALRGMSYRSMGDIDHAISDFARAIELDSNEDSPNYSKRQAFLYTYRAWCYQRKGDHDKVIADCTRAIEFDPEIPGPYMARGISYMATGDKAKAHSDFEKGVSLGGTMPPPTMLDQFQ